MTTVDTFPTRLRDMLTGHALTTLIAIGHRTGLFEAAARGPATSAGLAERAGLDERYVREWLGAMVTGGIVDHVDGRYALPDAHAALLTGAGASNVGPAANTLRLLGAMSSQVEDRFADGGGVPYAAYAATGRMGEQWRPIYDEHLIGVFLGAVPGLDTRLRTGARVLDVGCGTGHAVNLMAREYPRSHVTGLDLAPEAIAEAEAERNGMGRLGNAEFVEGDAAQLPASPTFDVITAFDAVHDQQAPEEVLRRIHAALAPDGVFVMVDTDFASSVDGNVGNPHAPLAYAISLLFCVPTSRAAGGPGLGAMWGRDTACAMLADAGFAEVTVLASPRPQNCIYVCRA